MKIFIIGRDPVTKPGEIPIRKNDPSLFMSNTHCKITVKDDKSMVIEDMVSKNGTFVNGRQINTPVSLHSTDSILLAKSFTINPGDFMNSPGLAQASSPHDPPVNKGQFKSSKPVSPSLTPPVSSGAASGTKVAFLAKLILAAIVTGSAALVTYNYVKNEDIIGNGTLSKMFNSVNIIPVKWSNYSGTYLQFDYPEYFTIARSLDAEVLLINNDKTASVIIEINYCDESVSLAEDRSPAAIHNFSQCSKIKMFQTNPVNYLKFGLVGEISILGGMENIGGYESWKKLNYTGGTGQSLLETFPFLKEGLNENPNFDESKLNKKSRGWTACSVISNSFLITAYASTYEDQWTKYSSDLDKILLSIKFPKLKEL